jgi:hypothetical protein
MVFVVCIVLEMTQTEHIRHAQGVVVVRLILIVIRKENIPILTMTAMATNLMRYQKNVKDYGIC